MLLLCSAFANNRSASLRSASLHAIPTPNVNVTHSQKHKTHASMLYAKTRDILLVKQQMGHKKIETTLVYTQLLQFEKDDNYTCRVAQNIEQATELIESGFEYVTEMNGLKLFRKRK